MGLPTATMTTTDQGLAMPAAARTQAHPSHLAPRLAAALVGNKTFGQMAQILGQAKHNYQARAMYTWAAI